MNYFRQVICVIAAVLIFSAFTESKCLDGLGLYRYKYGTLYNPHHLLPRCNPCLRSKLYSKLLALKKPLLLRPPLLRPRLCPCGGCPISYVPKCLKHRSSVALL